MRLDPWFAMMLTRIGHGKVWPVWGTEIVPKGNSVGWDRITVGDGTGE